MPKKGASSRNELDSEAYFGKRPKNPHPTAARKNRYDLRISETATTTHLRCASVDFIETECPNPIVPRRVICLAQVITIVIDSSADSPLACDFIKALLTKKT